MPGPMSLTGIVTKAGFMNKTATVTVSRHVAHPRTGKVCPNIQRNGSTLLISLQVLERSKKYLTHDEENSTCSSYVQMSLDPHATVFVLVQNYESTTPS